jgi:hypothetical protein
VANGRPFFVRSLPSVIVGPALRIEHGAGLGGCRAQRRRVGTALELALRRQRAAARTGFRAANLASYPNNFEQSYPVEIRNAKRIRVHLTRVETQPGDVLRYSKSFGDDDGIDEALSGNYPTGFWTHWFIGNAQFSFDSDAAGTAYGFATDKVQYVVGIPDQPSMPFLFDNSGGTVSFGVSPTTGAVSCYVYRSLAATSGYTRIATLPANVSDFTDSGLLIGRRYFYKVSCFNDLGEPPASPYLELVAQYAIKSAEIASSWLRSAQNTEGLGSPTSHVGVQLGPWGFESRRISFLRPAAGRVVATRLGCTTHAVPPKRRAACRHRKLELA